VPARKYFFTPEIREELRLAYCHKKHELTAALDRLAVKTEWPRSAFKREAALQGWTTRDHQRGWTGAEEEYLAEHIGRASIKWIAAKLRRTFESVRAKGEHLRLSRRAQEGYNIADLQQAFGESAATIRRWMERGLFGKVHRWDGHRVKELNVQIFIRDHTAEYDLRRVDQAWFKGLAFWANQNSGHGRSARSTLKD
jgi:hypothetical protein